MPETTNDNVSLADIYPIRVYDFISNSSGKVNFEEYGIIEFPFDKEDKEQIMNNSFVFKILGDNVQPHFIENDIIYFLKKEFMGWEILDRRLVLVLINKDYYIRKVHFIKGKPYLISFNENVYPEIEIDNKVKFIGVLGGLLKRYNNEIKF